MSAVSGDTLEAIRRLVQPVLERVKLALGWGTVQGVRDGAAIQELECRVLRNEVRRRVVHPQPYGFTSHPLEGASAFLGFVGGNRDHPVAAVVDDHRHRPELTTPGEVTLYTHEGDRFSLLSGRKVQLVTNLLEELVGSSTLTIDGASGLDFAGPLLQVDAGGSTLAMDATGIAGTAALSASLTVGPSSVTLTPAGVTIAAPLITLQGATQTLVVP